MFALSLPVVQLNALLGGMLECSGNLRVPGILNTVQCVLDVAFNYLFIYRLGLGVAGAALGTAAARFAVMLLLLYCTVVRSSLLALSQGGSWRLDSCTHRAALKIALPMGGEQLALCGAMVATTRIASPLGTVALAANSFAITAESLCYMPGYGIAAAATAIVGQCFGAGRREHARQFAWVTVSMGMAVMAVAGAVMYVCCPLVFRLLTPDAAVQALAVRVLRLELLSEPLFGASIVASGALRGAGDTLVPGWACAYRFRWCWWGRWALPAYGLPCAWSCACAAPYSLSGLAAAAGCGERFALPAVLRGVVRGAGSGAFWGRKISNGVCRAPLNR